MSESVDLFNFCWDEDRGMTYLGYKISKCGRAKQAKKKSEERQTKAQENKIVFETKELFLNKTSDQGRP